MLLKILHKIKTKIFNNSSSDSSKEFFTKDIFKNKKFIIGDYTYGKPNVLFENNETNLTIGKYCSIAHGVTIFLGGNHRSDWVSTYPFNVLFGDFPNGKKIVGHPAAKGDVVIGNDVWLARGSTVMSGVSIGNGAIVGAEALVVKNIGPYEVWAGNPAKLVKKRFKEDTITYLEKLEWWNWSIEKVNDNLHYLCSGNIEELKSNIEN